MRQENVNLLEPTYLCVMVEKGNKSMSVVSAYGKGAEARTVLLAETRF